MGVAGEGGRGRSPDIGSPERFGGQYDDRFGVEHRQCAGRFVGQAAGGAAGMVTRVVIMMRAGRQKPGEQHHDSEEKRKATKAPAPDH